MNPAARPPLVMDPRDEHQLRALLQTRLGISFDGQRRSHLLLKVSERMAVLGHLAPSTYLEGLMGEGGQAEFQHLVNAVTITETSFFREEHQFRCLVEDVIPRLRARTPDRGDLRIWSIPCGSGEEVWSIILSLLSLPGEGDPAATVVGSDINTQVLSIAQAGIYSERRLAPVPAHLRRLWFLPTEDGRFRIHRSLARRTQFIRHNVLEGVSTPILSHFDVIFCRNLLIYFDPDTRRRVMEQLYGALTPGGVIFLGHSETMFGISDRFQSVREGDTVFYVKG